MKFVYVISRFYLNVYQILIFSMLDLNLNVPCSEYKHLANYLSVRLERNSLVRNIDDELFLVDFLLFIDCVVIAGNEQ